ncbi:hypothetical protein EDD29_4437 [Actinocorallia herbida]|uniref:Uncharacterized protein n=1 Tax=Actinocorallia herbida TaxID=58109 RepID=A0A3N1CZZ6_9ACTN|nr:hypothetical protein [Actinocorallia herbida]ROO86855.1 hypothetical protein EDD29_4437 [Actinocorallia herbida]
MREIEIIRRPDGYVLIPHGTSEEGTIYAVPPATRLAGGAGAREVGEAVLAVLEAAVGGLPEPGRWGADAALAGTGFASWAELARDARKAIVCEEENGFVLLAMKSLGRGAWTSLDSVPPLEVPATTDPERIGRGVLDVLDLAR